MKRVLTAVVLIPIVVVLVWWGPGWLLFLAVLPVMGSSLWEYFELAGRMGQVSPRGVSYLGGLGLCLLGWRSPAYLLMALVAAGLLLLVSEFFLRKNHSEILPGAATGMLGLLYVALPFGFLLDLHARPSGPKLVLLLLVLIWVGDTAAYYGGRVLGRHKLAPRVSPGKTMEGSLASLVATLAVGFWLVRRMGWFPDSSLIHALALPLALNLAAQMGDLVESALKRGAGVKDSSQLLPGHGGMLDRIDSLLLAVPTLWYYCFFVLSR
ncbi:MAG: phosphatidate cytidylyltransferase [Terriglobia bacterium]